MEEILTNFFGSVLGQITVLTVIAASLVIAAFTEKKKFDVSVMVKTAILIAIAYVLNQVSTFMPFLRMPQGGSVTPFSMLFIVLVGYLFGIRQGIVAGVVFGLLDLLINPYVIHPIQLVLDYPLAFGALGIGAFLRNKKNGLIKTYLVGIFGRFVVSSISGIIFFMDITNGLMAGLYAAIAYNFTYIAVEGAITVIVLLIPGIVKMFDRFKK